jgi:2-polyprenyl-3-methyl-5-hydroxy-6-metoxy-1,4-benzoquinol methylase
MPNNDTRQESGMLNTGDSTMRTPAGERWRQMQDAARGQALRLGDPGWQAGDDPYAGRVESFRSGQRTDQNVVDCLASAVGSEASVLELGAGAGRLCLPLARAVREVVALEPSEPMAAALEADAREQGVTNVRVVRGGWQDVSERMADAVFAAHVVYSLPEIEAFVERLEQLTTRWCGLIVFADPPQSRLFGFWEAVFGETRLPNPALPQVLDVLWSLGIYPEVKMLEVPVWPLGRKARAQNGLRRRLHLAPGSPADARLESAISTLLVDWGDGALGAIDRHPLPVGVVSWTPHR